ncbi:hypothetical protein NDU88_004212 [Pleurodeles waltl]|uniref:Uncharacterized protein n=1 Tax=Pleurodeles waltl TaxID=8319 RepID=A0AAV7WUW1_PLEWA|nr:hypothetical protein NDU88_004212 [Pleurodeles waltl]
MLSVVGAAPEPKVRAAGQTGAQRRLQWELHAAPSLVNRAEPNRAPKHPGPPYTGQAVSGALALIANTSMFYGFCTVGVGTAFQSEYSDENNCGDLHHAAHSVRRHGFRYYQGTLEFIDQWAVSMY